MAAFETVGELGSGKNFDTAPIINMGENSSSETSPIMRTYEDNLDNESEARMFTPEEFDEQIRNYVAPLIK